MRRTPTQLCVVALSFGVAGSTSFGCAISAAEGNGSAGSAGVSGAGGSAAGMGGGSAGWIIDHFGPPPPIPGGVGDHCASDADCDGLSCLTTLGDEHIAGGLCSAPCESDVDCHAVAPRATCTKRGPGLGVCTEFCRPGLVHAGKCHDRFDVACAPKGIVNACATCVPFCRSDSQCPPGHSCDPATGLCGDRPSGGDPDGTLCDAPGTRGNCDGLCVDFGNGHSACTHLCVLGTRTDCEGACRSILGPGSGLGDLGVCLPTCTCNDDCQIPGWVCSAPARPGQGPNICTQPGPFQVSVPCD